MKVVESTALKDINSTTKNTFNKVYNSTTPLQKTILEQKEVTSKGFSNIFNL